MNDNHFDVIVAGLGVVGSAALYNLARRGIHALGLEQFDIMHALGSSAGFSRLFRTCYYEHPDYVPLLQRSFDLWNELNAIAHERDRSAVFHQTGGLLIGPPDGEFVNQSRIAAQQHHLPHELINADELRRRYPAFRIPDHFTAIFEPQMGLNRPSRTVALFLEEALKYGATIHAHQKLIDWSSPPPDSKSGHVTLRTKDNEYHADHVIFAAGPWSASILQNSIGVPLTVTRQIFAWVQPVHNPDQFRIENGFPVWGIDDCGGAIYYGFPMMHDNPGFKIAHHKPATTTDPNNVDRTIHPEDETTYRTPLKKHLPDADGPTLAARVCLYTNSPDGDFIIDRHPECTERITIACGFSGHGFKFAPAIGEALADLALTGRSTLPIDFLSLKRFNKEQ